MSVSIVLLPLALAAAAAYSERRARADASVEVQTRMRDPRLLRLALEDLGLAATDTPSGLVAEGDGQTVRFVRGDDDILAAHFSAKADVEAAKAFLLELDDSYAARVQQHVYERLVARAQEHGLRLEDERVQADNSIVLTLAVTA
jgi:hypothetical protein